MSGKCGESTVMCCSQQVQICGSVPGPGWKRTEAFQRVFPNQKTEPYGTPFFLVVPHFRKLRSLAPIKYLSCDRITIRYIRKWCRFRCLFTSHSQICDPITTQWVASKIAELSALFHSNSTNCDWIATWLMGGESASKTVSFTYILYCDTISTQILSWSQSTEFAKIVLCKDDKPGLRTAGLFPVQVTTPPKQNGSVFWTGWEPNQAIYLVQTRTTSGLLGPIDNTTINQLKAMRIAHLKGFRTLMMGETGMVTGIIQMTAQRIAQRTMNPI